MSLGFDSECYASPMPDDTPTVSLRTVETLAGIDAVQWDACALAPGAGGNPFLSHVFLKSLEDSKSVGRRTGWQPQYLLAEAADGTLLGAVLVLLVLMRRTKS